MRHYKELYTKTRVKGKHTYCLYLVIMEYEAGRDGRAGATSNTGLHLKVQGRDGKLHEFVVLPDGQEYYKNTLLPRTVSSTGALRLTPPVTVLRTARPAEELSLGPAGAFFSSSRDASNLVLTWLSPDSWMELEVTCRAGRMAVIDSKCWFSPGVMTGHSLRFRPDKRKAAFLRHRRAVGRVSKAFQVSLFFQSLDNRVQLLTDVGTIVSVVVTMVCCNERIKGHVQSNTHPSSRGADICCNIMVRSL